MPETEVALFQEIDGMVPLLAWMDGLPPKVQDKLIARVELLKNRGHELRRPHADILRNGIHELRVRHFKVQYRLLYFFVGQVAVVSHGITKEGEVPGSAIDAAVKRMAKFTQDPEGHTYREE